jgi:hypothetical protein
MLFSRIYLSSALIRPIRQYSENANPVTAFKFSQGSQIETFDTRIYHVGGSCLSENHPQ